VNRAVNAACAQQSRISGVYDGVDLLRRDVADEDLDATFQSRGGLAATVRSVLAELDRACLPSEVVRISGAHVSPVVALVEESTFLNVDDDLGGDRHLLLLVRSGLEDSAVKSLHVLIPQLQAPVGGP